MQHRIRGDSTCAGQAVPTADGAVRYSTPAHACATLELKEYTTRKNEFNKVQCRAAQPPACRPCIPPGCLSSRPPASRRCCTRHATPTCPVHFRHTARPSKPPKASRSHRKLLGPWQMRRLTPKGVTSRDKGAAPLASSRSRQSPHSPAAPLRCCTCKGSSDHATRQSRAAMLPTPNTRVGAEATIVSGSSHHWR